jgi:hypothetical protein
MPPDDFSEGVLRIFQRELPQQIQIACHFQKYIAAAARNPTNLFLHGTPASVGVQAGVQALACPGTR